MRGQSILLWLVAVLCAAGVGYLYLVQTDLTPLAPRIQAYLSARLGAPVRVDGPIRLTHPFSAPALSIRKIAVTQLPAPGQKTADGPSYDITLDHVDLRAGWTQRILSPWFLHGLSGPVALADRVDIERGRVLRHAGRPAAERASHPDPHPLAGMEPAFAAAAWWHRVRGTVGLPASHLRLKRVEIQPAAGGMAMAVSGVALHYKKPGNRLDLSWDDPVLSAPPVVTVYLPPAGAAPGPPSLWPPREFTLRTRLADWALAGHVTLIDPVKFKADMSLSLERRKVGPSWRHLLSDAAGVDDTKTRLLLALKGDSTTGYTGRFDGFVENARVRGRVTLRPGARWTADVDLRAASLDLGLAARLLYSLRAPEALRNLAAKQGLPGDEDGDGMNLSATLRADAVTYKALRLGKSEITVRKVGGRMDIVSAEMAGMDGRGKVVLSGDFDEGAVPVAHLRITASDLDAAPVFALASTGLARAGLHKTMAGAIDGRVDLGADLEFDGANGGLTLDNGELAAEFTDGHVRPRLILSLARDVRFEDGDRGMGDFRGGLVSFTCLAGAFDISNGRVLSRYLYLDAEDLLAAGSVDLDLMSGTARGEWRARPKDPRRMDDAVDVSFEGPVKSLRASLHTGQVARGLSSFGLDLARDPSVFAGGKSRRRTVDGDGPSAQNSVLPCAAPRAGDKQPAG